MGLHVHDQGACGGVQSGLGGGVHHHDVRSGDGPQARAGQLGQQAVGPVPIGLDGPDLTADDPVAGLQPLVQRAAQPDADDSSRPGAGSLDLGLQPRTIAPAGDGDDAGACQHTGFPDEACRGDDMSLGHGPE